MSDFYTSEPPTSGKVIIETNYGNIDIELFTLEAPKSCRNFIQHCLNKYYNGCIFFKIFKNFLIQTGDPTNTGKGGSSIYGEDFRDELHSRLKFSHRGIVAMANKNKPNTNGSQFFITMDKCEDMNKKFTIFGKVTGPTYFNALNISNLSADEDGCPIMKDDEKPKILNTEVVINPFKDLKPDIKLNKDSNITKKDDKKEIKETKKLEIGKGNDKMFFNEEEEDEGEEEDDDERENKDSKNKKKTEKKERNENSEEDEEKEENDEGENNEESESKSLS
jgi:peptidyl-prolyl cis-trans isomerase SDCCAG10